ncbi:MAG: DNA-directed RNA polymerase subunit K [Cenarchaeum symbiont of Oopsacas minuta]|nr:DNA-directed RNA polymerase subunit K [Cenarchaeum symbiont of Oopsacas minuta]
MSDNTNASQDAVHEESQATIDLGLAKSLTMYRKLIENGGTLSDEQQVELDKKLKEIETRDVVEADTPHDPLEMTFEKEISIGPPTLTRFEKARILGARALQLSLGAPTFIPIPEYAHTSLEIAMEELKRRVIPIVIKRTLPNGDYQNIGIEAFK